MRFLGRLLVLTFFLNLVCVNLYGSHIRAGEIIARRIDNLSLTYEFTFIGYRDNDTGIKFGNGTFDFGDGNEIEVGTVDFESQITRNIFRAEFKLTHTYNAPGNYKVSYQEKFRNKGIANIENSDANEFYTETKIVIDPFFGVNNSPILTVPPIDEGLPGVLFVHNAGAYDPDGDSLSYSITIPKINATQSALIYRYPANPEFYKNFGQGSEDGKPASLTINPANGDVIWDAPGDKFTLSGIDCPDGVDECSEYNLAFRIEEWRFSTIEQKWNSLGYVTRDMQIIIYEGDNEKPALEVPDPICVTAGDKISEKITGTDPDGHDVKIEAFGGPFEENQPATYSPNPPFYQNQPGTLNFDWNTVCGHIRTAPYEVQFKISDNPINSENVKVGPSLVDFETWKITVVGPSPTGLVAAANTGRSINVGWDTYACSNASEIEIWRRVGDFEIEIDECEIGMPSGTGYTRVAVIPTSKNNYIDASVAPGAKYCYRIVAKFPQPKGGTSYVSEEACLTLEADAPVITNVDINVTDSENGEINVRWTPPYETNPDQFPPPYTYNVIRSSGSSLAAPVVVAENISDTFFIDQGINTELRDYSYRISLFDGGGNYVDSSAVASSVFLNATPLLNAIEIKWKAKVPWSNNMEEYPYHLVYRDQVLPDDPDRLVLIDTVFIAKEGFSYLDDGSFNEIVLDEEIEYCYYVLTQGAYDNPLIPEPLLNRSQVICAQPNDNVPPCEPINLRISNDFSCETVLATENCNFSDFKNLIEWDPDIGAICEDDVRFYRIFYSNDGLEESYVMIDSTVESFYLHTGLSSFKGCYKITALDRSLNESPFSNPLCIDNCPSYTLPNVFTPNNDGINDTFTPLYSGSGNFVNNFNDADCPRFVLDVSFVVFDRTGKKVFDLDKKSEKSMLIHWDGKTNSGVELSTGVYYYVAEVTFDVLEIHDRKQTFKGWVQLLK